MDIKLVMHKSYGGFHIDKEMALWLSEHCNWSIGGKECDLTCQISDYYSTNKFDINSIELRSNPDLIKCVEALQNKHQNDSYSDKYYNYIYKLKIINYTINLSIEDYHDGKEKLNVYCYDE